MQEQIMIDRKDGGELAHYNTVILKTKEKIVLGGIELEFFNGEENVVKARLEAKRRGRFVRVEDQIKENKCSVYNLKEGKVACIMVEEIHHDEEDESAYAKVRVDMCPPTLRSC